MEERSIRIQVAGRGYPLTVKASEEGTIRAAAEKINSSIERLRANYPHTDQQDLVAMAALEVTTRSLNTSREEAQHLERSVVTQLELLLNEFDR